MIELKKTKSEFFIALKSLIKLHTKNLTYSRSYEEAQKKTLKEYDDFYEWLQGKV